MSTAVLFVIAQNKMLATHGHQQGMRHTDDHFSISLSIIRFSISPQTSFFSFKITPATTGPIQNNGVLFSFK